MNNPLFSAESKKAFWGESVENKSSLRQKIIKDRTKLNPKVSAYKSSIINSLLPNLPESNSAETIACYNHFRNEVDVNGFIQWCLLQNKRVVFPKVKNKELEFYHVKNIETSQKTGAFGILEPDESLSKQASADEIDVYIVPAVAFDLFGYRVGYGGGYYDRYLQNKRDDSITVGVGYDMQLRHGIQPDPHDIALDMVVTDQMQSDNVIEPVLTEVQTNSPEETQQMAVRLAENGLIDQPVVALHGDLGVGKTEFVKGLAKECEVVQTVSSPTYVFIHDYEGKTPLRHIDCYRLDHLQDEDTEFWHESIFSVDRCIVIEWAEKIGSILPFNAVHIYGKRTGEDARTWKLFTAYRNQKHLHEILPC